MPTPTPGSPARLALTSRGRGGRYSVARGLVESALRVIYQDGWAARAWGRVPGATRVRLAAHGLPVLPKGPARAALRVHSPDGLPLVRGRGAALLVCGHTHGGQVALPGPRPVVVPSRMGKVYPWGLHDLGDLALFVSRGLGGVEVPVRSWAPPDIALFTLGA